MSGPTSRGAGRGGFLGSVTSAAKPGAKKLIHRKYAVGRAL
jgi:hypothetical protein